MEDDKEFRVQLFVFQDLRVIDLVPRSLPQTFQNTLIRIGLIGYLQKHEEIEIAGWISNREMWWLRFSCYHI